VIKTPKVRIVKPRRNSSAVEIRRGQITRQLERLRSRLITKSPSQYADETACRRHLGRTRELVSELEGELLMLDCPGEYDELPAAVVADELGLRLDQVKHLIRLGEVEAAGSRAHPRVSRAELERLAQLRPGVPMTLAAESAESIFTEAVGRLRAGDLVAAQRAYNRIRARETCIGEYALTLEIALGLAEGRYGDADRVVRFILSEVIRHRDAVCTHLTRALRGARFKSNEARSVVLKLLKLLGADFLSGAERGVVEAGTELTALYIAAAAQRAVSELVTRHLPPSQLSEFNCRLRNAVFAALYARAHAGASVMSMSYLVELEHRVPHFWEPLQLSEDLREE
jgi:hypothetical protein